MLVSSIRCQTESTTWCEATETFSLYEFKRAIPIFFSLVLQQTYSFFNLLTHRNLKNLRNALCFPQGNWHCITTYDYLQLRPLSQLCCWTVCVMLAQFTEMIGILLNNCPKDIIFRFPLLNVTALLLLLFKIWVNLFSSLHVATVETQRYAFLLFSVVMTIDKGELFYFHVRRLRHATSCSRRKLFYGKLISWINLIALFSEGNSVYVFGKWGFMT
jgi:hypothetical protein